MLTNQPQVVSRKPQDGPLATWDVRRAASCGLRLAACALRLLSHTIARRHVPEAQNSVIATPRATAVTLRAIQIPSRPSVADPHAASGTRSTVSDVLTTCGPKVYPAPASAPSRMISNVCPI